MTNHQALRLAIAALEKEKRIKRQFYEMYLRGFTFHKPGHDRYLQLGEAIEILKKLQTRI